MNGFGWLVVATAVVSLLTGCSNGVKRSSTGAITEPGTIDVFDLREGDCIVPPENVTAELEHVSAVPCTDPHPQEVYSFVEYPVKDPKEDAYPGDAVLKNYADAHCQDNYESYVGVSYSDSDLFYTYMLPSARGWTKEKDRKIVCVITTTGDQLRDTVHGSKR